MKLIEESDYFLAWLATWLSSTVGGFLLGAVIGGVLGAILGGMGVAIAHIKIICALTGFLLGIMISFAFFRLFVHLMIVRKIESHMVQPVSEQKTEP